MDRYGVGRHTWNTHAAAAQLLADEMTREAAWWLAARSGSVAYPALVWADRAHGPRPGSGSADAARADAVGGRARGSE